MHVSISESPLNTQQFKRPSVFNWTATYRSDSTVVTPYERWEYYDPGVRALNQTVNYAANKTKKARVLASRIKGKGEGEEVLTDFWDYTCDLTVKTAFWKSNVVQQLLQQD